MRPRLGRVAGYRGAIDLFVAAEESQAALIARRIAYLNQPQLHKQWTNSILAERLQDFTPATRRLWCLQFRLIHRFMTAVVSWDHRDCLKAIEVTPAAFRSRCTQSLERFMDRLETKITKTLPHPAPDTAVAAAS